MEQEFTIRRLPGVENKVRLEPLSGGRHRATVMTTTAIPQSFLDARAAERGRARDDNGGRAPTGDSHGAWQKVAEIPLSLLLKHVPFDAFQDQTALRRLVNDPDFQLLRSDVEQRKF